MLQVKAARFRFRYLARLGLAEEPMVPQLHLLERIAAADSARELGPLACQDNRREV